jgi:uncharacterized membrane protein
MSDSARTLGRRDALRGCVGLAATAAVAAQPTAAQDGNETATPGNETTGNETATPGNETADNETAAPNNETAENETTTPDNETADNETAAPTDSEEMDTANETAESEGSDGGASGAAGPLSTEGVVAVFLGILAAALFSPLLFALIMKTVYDDETSDETAHEYRPE